MRDLSKIFEDLNPRIQRINDEGLMIPPDINYQNQFTLLEDDSIDSGRFLDDIIFVDSRRRTFESITVSGYVTLLCQIITGSVRFKKGECFPLFSPDDGPKSKLVLGIPKDFANIANLKDGEELNIGKLNCITCVGEDAKSAIEIYMQHAEQLEVENQISECLTIKDGSIDFATPAFKKNRGPIGLVKNVQKAFVNFETFNAYAFMKSGERSKSIIAELGHDRNLLRIMSYLKLINKPGLRGLVRIETIIDKSEFNQTKESIFSTFNSLARTLPLLTDQSSIIPRTPEDVLPVIFLEKYLDKYFYDPVYVHCAVLESFGEKVG